MDPGVQTTPAPGRRQDAARVSRSVGATLGCNPRQQSVRGRRVWVQTDKELLCVVTNRTLEELAAGEVAQRHKERWRIELFFRWLKCLCSCRHGLAESPAGAASRFTGR
jgi:IS4 transposase